MVLAESGQERDRARASRSRRVMLCLRGGGGEEKEGDQQQTLHFSFSFSGWVYSLTLSTAGRLMLLGLNAQASLWRIPYLNRLLTCDSREAIEKLIQSETRREVIEQRCHRDARPAKHGRAAQDFRITGNRQQGELLIFKRQQGGLSSPDADGLPQAT
jgi:hypothetical protein